MPIPPDDREQALAKANEEIYKRNFELSIRNKTLSVLRALYAIAISSFDIAEVSQRVVDTVAKEFNFSATLITLIDSDGLNLRPIAITNSDQIQAALKFLNKPLEDIAIPMDFPNNLVVTAIKKHERQITSNMLDILDPQVSQSNADQISQITEIQTLVIYPLTLGDRTLGAFLVGISKKVDDLSRAERETLDELIGVISIAIDHAQLNQHLREANSKLEVLDKLKDEFVSVASHELRTPMTAIKSYTWMVLNGKSETIGPKTREYLDRVYQSTDRLIHLVNEMLDVSRIEGGRVTLKFEPMDMAKLAVDVQNEFSARSAETGLTLTVEPLPSQPTVTADREKIHQVLENLVGNSFKFTPKGGHVTISFKINSGFLETLVTDDGPGIAPDDLPRLFKKFGRLENSLIALANNSTGLGLYISKQYVELHHGQIWVNSQPGSGATFTFSLPIS